ncbi:radical SAM superfamily enzyme YgiQ (UPF0313 family) [Anaerosolibacter carboniphilus]|uniref:Radical SAM superfamily enzyme YgiQ (UPF0313 family) n=1 Tax=Anaerosolibacter carboniphilus TaxID=1417629 RepID=A0A841L4D7_9FIRM|nr:radical SAM protein [Anaerosolibacter carboniphilus]MBB6219020.1 radical SAM superfamily enzyme YgiQ (UPF0313 family) [Anaerosolibacter carboniphilus]
MNIARVFPRKTKATPIDPLVFFDGPPMLALPEIDEVHISVTFTYDMEKAERLAYQWERIGVPVKIGGPAIGKPAGEFTPGLYLKEGYTITSRGCPNHCWFCQVPKRQGGIKECHIHEGNNILDDNILACSEEHIRKVFEMLKKQKYGRPIFSGGLEAKILKNWHVDLLREVKPKQMFFAYDTPDDYEPLVEAGRKLLQAGFTTASHTLRCYVLMGYKGDTFEKAEKRLIDTIKAGFMPFAMLYKDADGKEDSNWAKFRSLWVRPAGVYASNKKYFAGEGEKE